MMWPYLTKGPMQADSDIDLCKKYWWRNVLYISNFFDTTEIVIDFFISIDNWCSAKRKKTAFSVEKFLPIILRRTKEFTSGGFGKKK